MDHLLTYTMEHSESGAPIHRHEERTKDFEIAAGDEESIDRISDHIEKHLGPVSGVFHELISDLVHIDIHIVDPTPDRNFYTLVTSGMSDRAMSAPEEYPDLGYSELMVCLPPYWPMDQDSWKKEENYWPVRMLKMLARFPHEYDTWLWAMHTIPNGDPAEPYASNTNMSSIMLLPPILGPPEFRELKIDDTKTIHFHALLPLHADELELKMREGAEALFDGFEENDVYELLDPARSSSLGKRGRKKKKGWWPFG